VPTVFLFDAPIARDSVQWDSTILQLVDVGERSLIILPRVSPGSQEQWVLRVRYADGARPEWAAFALVSRPPEVDARVDVVRRPQSLEACQAALVQARAQGAAPRSELWRLADRLAGAAVEVKALSMALDTQDGLRAEEGKAYRFATGVLLVLSVSDAADAPPWAPTEATLRSTSGLPVPVRAVSVREGPIKPGEKGQVVVEAEPPPPEAGRIFTLELRAADGRSLTLEHMELLPAAAAPKGGGR
jgi:uncharacterized protein (TIGR02268 family)